MCLLPARLVKAVGRAGRAAYLHWCKVAVRVAGRHPHGRENRGRGRRSVRGASRARVVLAAAPGETNARVADGVALHLVDGHLGSVSLNELHEAASLAGGYLDVGNLAKALEERTQLVLGDVAGQAADEDGGVVGVGELIHRLGSAAAIVAHGRSAHGVHADRTTATTAAAAAAARRHAAHGGTARTAALVLGGRGADAHGPVAAVHALHLGESLLLVLLAGESDKSIAARHSGDGVRHDLGRLARRELVLKQLDEDELVDLGAKVADEDGVFGTAVVAAGARQHGPMKLQRRLTCDQRGHRQRPSSA